MTHGSNTIPYMLSVWRVFARKERQERQVVTLWTKHIYTAFLCSKKIPVMYGDVKLVLIIDLKPQCLRF